MNFSASMKQSLAATLLALSAVAFPFFELRAQEKNASPPPAGIFRNSLTIDRKELDRDAPMRKSYAGMLEKVQPSVVTVLTGIETPQPQTRSMEEEALRFFFGLPTPPRPQDRAQRQKWQQIGLGTGVIVTKDGYVLTNRHVVLPPDMQNVPLGQLSIKVSVPGYDENMDAEIVDYSREADIAVLKITGKNLNLPAAVLADSDQVKVGDVVFALGAPFGIDKTVTMGIVSARRYDEVLAGFDKQELLQTDASINPGNSGGPLVDAEGRVIGINTAIYTRNGGNMGIGFAIPINNAVAAADALSRPRGFLGVQLERVRLNRRAAAYYGIKGGAYVASVVEGSPAAHAGLQPDDVIFRFNDEDVTDHDKLLRDLSTRAPGEMVTLGILREDRKFEVRVRLGEKPNPFLPPAAERIAQKGENSIAGMKLAPVPDQERESLRLSSGGLVVTDIEPNSPAARCGLEKGDVILKINGRQPGTALEAADALQQARGGSSMLHIRRGSTTMLRVLENP